MKNILIGISILLLLVTSLSISTFVEAQIPQIFYISDTGNDLNDCAVTPPCRSFSNTHQKGNNGKGRYPSGIVLSNERYNHTPYFRNTSELQNVEITNNNTYAIQVSCEYKIA
jgi:hypothetical protein